MALHFLRSCFPNSSGGAAAIGQMVALAAVVLVAGCAHGGSAGTGRYVVTATKSPFYKYGPAQAFGADFALNRGQKVTVVESSFGFAKVTTEDGIAGYMPTDDLSPAPPEPAPQVRSEARAASRRVGSTTRPATYTEPGAPVFDANDIPLPSHATPTKVEPPAPNPKSKQP